MQSSSPLPPLSDAPTPSTISRFGKCAKKSSFTAGENTAAVLVIEEQRREIALLRRAASASTSGRPMASPVIISACTRSASTRRHTSAGSNFATSTFLWPTKLRPITDHCVAPCISGAIEK